MLDNLFVSGLPALVNLPIHPQNQFQISLNYT